MDKYLSLCLVLTVLGGCGFSSRQKFLVESDVVLNKARGDLIIDGLNKYYSKNNTYPQDISNLVPDYIKSIPNTTFEEGFFYNFSEFDGFTLSFQYGLTSCFIDKNHTQWFCP